MKYSTIWAALLIRVSIQLTSCVEIPGIRKRRIVLVLAEEKTPVENK
jgi:hypothetical protein